MRAAASASAEFKFQLSVVGTNAYRAVETSSFRPDISFPDENVVRIDAHFHAIHLGTKRVGSAGAQQWHRRTVHRLDIAIAAVPAFRAGVLARIGFYGNDELGLRLDAPHRVDEIARVLSAKLEAKLTAHLAGA